MAHGACGTGDITLCCRWSVVGIPLLRLAAQQPTAQRLQCPSTWIYRALRTDEACYRFDPERAVEMLIVSRSFIVSCMSGKSKNRAWAWLLCALLLWLTVSPPHCDLCDSNFFSVALSQQSVLQHSHPVAPDNCNGICSCCGFYGLPNNQQFLISVNPKLANVSPEVSRSAFPPPSAIFRPPRKVAS
jgi:hypothetical protein